MNDNTREWKKVKDLAIGTQIAVPRSQVFEQYSETLPELVGMGDWERAEMGEGDMLWDEIVEIKKVGEEQVYDIEVEGTHNFVAGHLLERPVADLARSFDSKEQRGVMFGGIFAHNTYLSGNVGIGTTSPNFKLETIGTASSSLLFVGGTGLTATTTQIYGGLIADVDSNTLVVNANENRVGIGTNAPTTTLGVLGTTRLNGATTITGALTLNSLTASRCLELDGSSVVTAAGSACAAAGQNGAWQNLWTNTLSPTNTSAGIFAYASSTFNSTLRVNDSLIASSTLQVGTAPQTSTTTLAYGGAIFDFESNTLVVNANENRVGIGTAGPTALLNVHAAAGSDPTVYVSDGDVAHGITGRAPANVFGKLQVYGSTTGGLHIEGFSDDASTRGLNLVGSIGSADPTDTIPAIMLNGRKYNGGTDVQALGDAETILNIANHETVRMTVLGSGNVGIGTTSPNFKLETIGTASSSLLFVGGTGLTATTTQIYGGLIADVDSNTLVVNANENRVGIGTATPSTTLGVIGATRLNGTAVITGALTLNSLTASRCLELDGSSVVTAAGSACAAAGQNGAWQNLWTNTLSPTNTSAGIYVSASSTILTLKTDSLTVSSDSAITDITGTGLNLQSGALSVNTSSGLNLSPWGFLFTNTLAPTNTSAGIFSYASSTFNDNLRVNGSLVASSTIQIGTAPQTATTTLIYGGLIADFESNTLVVNANENRVGIGTASPSTTLGVVGNTRLNGTLTMGQNIILNGTYLSGDGGNEGVFVASDGNVGIGTTGPSTKLTISDTTNVTSLKILSTGITTQAAFGLESLPLSTDVNTGKAFSFIATGESFARGLFYSDGKYGIGGGSAVRDIYISRNAANVLKVSSDGGSGAGSLVVTGNVGIGTTAPNFKLETIGTASSSLLFVGGAGLTATTTQIYGGLIADVNDNTLVVNANENRVGIGTASPSTTLGVLGTTRLNGAVTVAGALTINTITGSTQCLQIDTNGLVAGSGAGCGGGSSGAPGAWEATFGGSALTPTSTSAGVFVLASSTFNDTLRVNGAFFALGTATSTFTSGATFDTSTLVVNANENRVGIGTASPTSTFAVAGSFNFSTSATGPSYLFGTSAGNIGIATTTPDAIFMIGKTDSRALAVRDNAGSDYFVVDTSSATTAGLDVTASGGQTSNLMNFYSSGNAFLSGFTVAGGMLMNINSTTAVTVQRSGTNVFSVDTTNYLVQVASSTRTFLYMDANNGRFGINTTTPYSIGTTTIVTIEGGVCIDDTSGASCGSRLVPPGNLDAEGAVSSNAFDLAEIYGSDGNVEAGEVVRIYNANVANGNANNTNGGMPAVERTEGAYERDILGAVSTDPGFVMGWTVAETDVKVTLSGRIPIKVTDENGPIAAGDLLVSAPTPGYAMRYNSNGDNLIAAPTSTFAIIGIALEEFPISNSQFSINGSNPNVQTGKILVFVNLEHQRLTATASGDLGELIVVESNANAANLNTNATNSRIRFMADAIFAYKLAAENGQWQIDEQGLLVVKEIQTEKIKITGQSTVGFGRIKAGEIGVTIDNAAMTDKSLVFVTFLGDLAGRSYYISEKTAGAHFTVKLSGNLSTDADFQWWIVESDLDYNAFVQSQTNPNATNQNPNATNPPSLNPSPFDSTQGEGGLGTGGEIGEVAGTSTASTTSEVTAPVIPETSSPSTTETTTP